MNDKPNHSTPVQQNELSRRSVVKAAGAATALGMTAPVYASQDSPEQQMNPEQVSNQRIHGLDLGGRLVVGSVGFDTIEDALASASDGDTIYVHSSYDAEAAGEDFPIVLDYREKEVALVGGHPSGSEIDARHQPDANVIEVIGRGNSDFRNTPLIQNLKIVGGNVGIKVVGAPNGSFSHLKLFLTQSHGVHITTNDEVDRGTFGTRWYDCEAWSCGGSGFRTDAAAAPHGTTFIRCNSTYNGYNGNHPGVHLRGFSSVWQSGTIQQNSSYGITFQSGGSQVLRDSYLESNGIESDFPVHVNARGTIGLVIEGNYFNGNLMRGSRHQTNNGKNRVYRAITLHNAHTTSVRANTYRWHRDGFIAVQGSWSHDNDLYEHSNHNIGGNGNFLVHDYGNRTRSNGVIREQDLRDVDGKNQGDQGIHDGSGLAPWGPAMWNGSSWVSIISGDLI